MADFFNSFIGYGSYNTNTIRYDTIRYNTIRYDSKIQDTIRTIIERAKQEKKRRGPNGADATGTQGPMPGTAREITKENTKNSKTW